MRDWTPTDAADAADAAYDRQWWKRDPFAEDCPDPDEALADLSTALRLATGSDQQVEREGSRELNND